MQNHLAYAIVCLDYDGCGVNLRYPWDIINYDYNSHAAHMVLQACSIISRDVLVNFITDLLYNKGYNQVILTCGSNRQSIATDKGYGSARSAFDDYSVLSEEFFSSDLILNKILLPDLLHGVQLGSSWDNVMLDYLPRDKTLFKRRDYNGTKTEIKWKNQILFNQLINVNEITRREDIVNDKVDIFFIDDMPKMKYNFVNFAVQQSVLFNKIFSTNAIPRNDPLLGFSDFKNHSSIVLPNLSNITINIVQFDHFENVNNLYANPSVSSYLAVLDNSLETDLAHSANLQEIRETIESFEIEDLKTKFLKTKKVISASVKQKNSDFCSDSDSAGIGCVVSLLRF